MTIQIAVASKHGATLGIANAVADELRAMEFDVHVQTLPLPPPEVHYQAIIIGSAVYMGKWMPEAQQFALQRGVQQDDVPVWLFSSGPIGEEDPQPKTPPSNIDELMEATGARGHRLFAGKLDRGQLGLVERLITRFVIAPEGDFRDWNEIRGWAREIGSELGSATDNPA